MTTPDLKITPDYELVYGAIEIAAGDSPPTEFPIFAPGVNVFEGKGQGLFDAQSAALVMAAAKEHGVDKMIDLEHLSLDTESVNFDPDARGWMKLEVRGTAEAPELWATNVTWTTDGARRLKEKTQRYISPVFSRDRLTQRIVRVTNVALTALPASHGIAPLIAASLARVQNASHSDSGRTEVTASNIQNPNAGDGQAGQAKGVKMLEGKNAVLAGTWLSQVKSVAETAEDAGLKDLASKTAESLATLLGPKGAEDASKVLAAQVAEAAQAAQVAELAIKVAASVRTLTGKDKPEEIAATVSSWKQRAESGSDTTAELVLEVATLKARDTERSIRDVLASNRDKCTPALEKHFMRRNVSGALVETVESVSATLGAMEKRPAQSTELEIVKDDPNAITMTKADEDVCAALGTDPKKFLAQKKLIATQDLARMGE